MPLPGFGHRRREENETRLSRNFIRPVDIKLIGCFPVFGHQGAPLKTPGMSASGREGHFSVYCTPPARAVSSPLASSAPFVHIHSGWPTRAAQAAILL